MKGEYDFTDLDLRESKSNLEYVDNKYNKIQFSSIEPLRKWDRFVFKDGQLVIERGSKNITLDGSKGWSLNSKGTIFYASKNKVPDADLPSTNSIKANLMCKNRNVTNIDYFYTLGNSSKMNCIGITKDGDIGISVDMLTKEEIIQKLNNAPIELVYRLAEPTYEEVPFELQKIILEGYENGTLFFDTNIPPTATVTYAGETPIVKATKLNKTEVSNNTADINDNILPYLMDMDYRIVMLQLATEELEGEVSMARLFGGTYEMLKRDILSKRLSRQEYGYRLADYFNAGKLTEEQVRELEELR